ncbi:MAG: succinate dehydrogenase, cytochrome b556 subunit [Brevundimonas sp.]|nr:MAG: succinate dehydrogenase, cytochrome b556 subunit [Brevundimonas sp.]
MSPHMSIWRWHITMLASIAMRATIIAATFGAAFVVAWLAVLANGPDATATFLGLAASPIGLLIGIGLTWVLFSLLLNGGRHLLNDAVIGLELKPADLLSHISVWGPFVLTALFWVALFATGRVSL